METLEITNRNFHACEKYRSSRAFVEVEFNMLENVTFQLYLHHWRDEKGRRYHL